MTDADSLAVCRRLLEEGDEGAFRSLVAGMGPRGLFVASEVADQLVEEDEADSLTLLVRWLPELKAAREESRVTLLGLAVCSNATACVQALLEASLVSEAESEAGDWTPMQLAAYYDHPGMIRLLHGHGFSVGGDALHDLGSPLCSAAQENSLQAIATLVELGAPVVEPESELAAQPISQAAGEGNLKALELLLDASARQNAPATLRFLEHGLVLACCFDRVDCARLLIERGVSPSTVDNEGTSCLKHAALKASPKMVRFLLEQGARTDAIDASGTSFGDFMRRKRLHHLRRRLGRFRDIME